MGGKRLAAFDLVFLDCTLTLVAENTAQSKAFANLLRTLVPPPLTEEGLMDSSGARLCFVACAECKAKHARRVRDVVSGAGDEAICTECGAMLPQSAAAARHSCDAVFDEDEDETAEAARLSSRLQLILSEQGETAAVEAAESPRAGGDAVEAGDAAEAATEVREEVEANVGGDVGAAAAETTAAEAGPPLAEEDAARSAGALVGRADRAPAGEGGGCAPVAQE